MISSGIIGEHTCMIGAHQRVKSPVVPNESQDEPTVRGGGGDNPSPNAALF